MGAVRYMVVVSLVLFCAGQAGAQPKGNVLAGKRIYNQTCVACHGADGHGTIPGAPDFASPTGPLNKKSDSVLLKHILNGFRAPGSPIAMPPDGGNPNLTIRDLRDVLAYMHEAFHYAKHYDSPSR